MYQELKKYGKVKLNEPMSKHTTFKIGGPARYFIIVDNIENLINLLKFLDGEGVNRFVLGGGSNLLFSDSEFDGVVVKIKNSGFEIEETAIKVEAGMPLAQLLALTMKNELTGLEWASGVPGTVGGAVRGNAGAMGADASQSLKKVTIYRDGEVIDLDVEDCEYAYRESIFKNNDDIILSAYFQFKKGKKQEVVQKVQEYLSYRTGRFPAFPSGGSFFKNLPISAWTGEQSELPEKFVQVGKLGVAWLIDQAGMKGVEVGGAKVSDEHANFVVNFNNATQSDVLKLVEKVKEAVYNKYRIELEEEVQIIN